jgi:hypothetical protein
MRGHILKGEFGYVLVIQLTITVDENLLKDFRYLIVQTIVLEVLEQLTSTRYLF